jgi:alkylhydroperoxidase family enzyme
MRPLGAGILGPHSSIDPHERELVIDRTCARCGCEYEWGVHVTAYGTVVGLSQEHLQKTVTADAQDTVWTEREQTLLALVDELHETSTISDELWERLVVGWNTSQIIELIVTVGWYHIISFVANAAHIEHEPWAVRFPRLEP